MAGKNFYVAGIDIGGTTAKGCILKGSDLGGLAAPKLKIMRGTALERPSAVRQGPQHVIDEVIPDLLSTMAQAARVPVSAVQAIGCDFPCPVDEQRGRTLNPGNMGHPAWEDYSAYRRLQTRLKKDGIDVPVSVFNDGVAQLAGVRAELPANRRNGTVIGLFVGTGLGGGALMGGRNRFNNESGGSEPGASQIFFDEERTLLGTDQVRVTKRKLEDFVSLVGIERQLKLLYDAGVIPAEHSLMQITGTANKSEWRCRAEKLLKVAVKALEENDLNHFSLRIFRVQQEALGLYLQLLTQAIRPSDVFIGGGVVDSNNVTDQFRKWYVDGIADQTRTNILQAARRISGFPKFRTPKRGDMAAPFGAAILAAEKLTAGGKNES